MALQARFDDWDNVVYFFDDKTDFGYEFEDGVDFHTERKARFKKYLFLNCAKDC